MGPEKKLTYSRALRDEILVAETATGFEAGKYLGEVAQGEIRARSENHPSIDATPLLVAKTNGKTKVQALENLLDAVRKSRPLEAIESGALLTIRVESEEPEKGRVLEDSTGTYFYFEPEQGDSKPFNGLEAIPEGPKIMLRKSSLLSQNLFFRSKGEEFDFIDEEDRVLFVKVEEVE